MDISTPTEEYVSGETPGTLRDLPRAETKPIERKQKTRNML
jgi:hypothetical protein